MTKDARKFRWFKYHCIVLYNSANIEYSINRATELNQEKWENALGEISDILIHFLSLFTCYLTIQPLSIMLMMKIKMDRVTELIPPAPQESCHMGACLV